MRGVLGRGRRRGRREKPERRGLRGGDERAGDGIGEVVLFPERVVDGVPPTARDPALQGENFGTKTVAAAKIESRQMSETHAAAMAVLAATPDCLEAILRPLPRVTTERAADGDWSPKDVAAHLLISEDQGAVGRFRAIAGSNDAHLPSYDEQAELERSEWRKADFGALLAEFRMRREANVACLTALS